MERPRPADPVDGARRLQLQRDQLEMIKKRAAQMGIKARTVKPPPTEAKKPAEAKKKEETP